MKRTMTKAQALKLFKETHKEFLKKTKNDVVARRTAWNDFTDVLAKDGEITQEQYQNWSNPY